MKGRKALLFPALVLGASSLYGCSLSNCTVTWLDWDGKILERDDNVFLFEFTSYDGETPTRQSTAKYDFEFDHWEGRTRRIWKTNSVFTAAYKKTTREYEVTFETNSGIILNTQTLKYGETPEFTPNMSQFTDAQYYYHFTGWDQEIVPVTGDTTYTTTFDTELRYYDVLFRDNDGTVLDQQSVAYGVTPQYKGVLPTTKYTYRVDNPDKVDQIYEFKGWDKQLSPVKGPTTYIAQYDVHTAQYFDLEFKVSDGNTFVSQYHLELFEHSDIELETLLTQGSFIGHDISWFLSPHFEKPVTEVKDVYDNMVFYGKDEGAHEFNVAYNLAGGDAPIVSNPTTVTYDDNIALNDPSLTGYSFAGWRDGQGNVLSSLYHVLHDVELTATYSANVYNVTFNQDPNGRILSTVSDYNFEQTFDKVIDQNKLQVPDMQAGYSFEGWKLDGESDYFGGVYKYDHDVALDPVVKAIDYPITYKLQDGAEITTQNYPTSYNLDNVDTLVLPDVERKGYEFIGSWKVLNWPNNPVIAALNQIPNILGPVTLEPIWAVKSYDVSFDFNGGTREFDVKFFDEDGTTLLQEEKIAYGVNEISYPVLEDKEGSQFAGWDNFPTQDYKAEQDLEFVAKFNEIENGYIGLKIGETTQIDLHNMNGKYCQFTSLLNQRIRVESDGELDLLMNPDQFSNLEQGINQDNLNYWFEFDATAGESYKFKLFGCTNTDGITNITISNKNGDPFLPSTKIMAKEITSVDKVNVYFDEEVTGFVPVAKAGYEFVGWFYEGNDGDVEYKEGSILKEDSNITLVAHWEEIPQE